MLTSKTPHEKKVLIYAENWPASDEIATTGLDRALVPIIKSLAPLRPSLLLRPPSLRSVRYPLHPQALLALGVKNSLHAAFRVITDRQNCRSILEQRLNADRKSGVLFSVLGGEPESYHRAHLLAKREGLMHVPYSVDDPFAWSERRIRDKEMYTLNSERVINCFAEARSVVAITPELAATLKGMTSQECIYLPLPYLEPIAKRLPTKRQLIYVGNMNHLYFDSFVQFIEAVSRRRKSGDDLKIRVTFPRSQISGALQEIPDFISFGRISNRNEFLSEIASSICAICPISFLSSEVMVKSSFPSKLLDYLGHARAVIVHGPPDSVAAKYFLEHRLDYVSNSVDELDRILEKVSTLVPDDLERNRTVVDRLHGSTAFLNKFSELI